MPFQLAFVLSSANVFNTSTVTYYSSAHPSTPFRISACAEIDDEFLFAEAAANYKECVASRAVLNYDPPSHFTQYIIDQGIAALVAGTPYDQSRAAPDKVCKHHLQL